MCVGGGLECVYLNKAYKHLVFLLVSDIKEPSENFTGDVDIEKFWDSVQLEMIARGFFPSTDILILSIVEVTFI